MKTLYSIAIKQGGGWTGLYTDSGRLPYSGFCDLSNDPQMIASLLMDLSQWAAAEAERLRKCV